MGKDKRIHGGKFNTHTMAHTYRSIPIAHPSLGSEHPWAEPTQLPCSHPWLCPITPSLGLPPHPHPHCYNPAPMGVAHPA
eukprot:scaffold1453_cov112-Isochrysis_galbana.AAC.7